MIYLNVSGVVSPLLPPPLRLSLENLLNKILKSNGNLEVLLRKHISFRARVLPLAHGGIIFLTAQFISNLKYIKQGKTTCGGNFRPSL